MLEQKKIEIIAGSQDYDGTDIVQIAQQVQGGIFTPTRKIKVSRLYIGVEITSAAGGVVWVYSGIYDTSGNLLVQHDSSLGYTNYNRVGLSGPGFGWAECPLASEYTLDPGTDVVIAAKFRGIGGPTFTLPGKTDAGNGRYQSGGSGWGLNNPATLNNGDEVPCIFAWGAREWNQLSPPPGFGKEPFGNPLAPIDIAIYDRGFGSP